MEKKITKKEYFEAIRVMVGNVEDVAGIPAEEVVEFIDKQIAQIDNKAAKAKEKASEKKAEGDALRAVVQAALTDTLQTIDAITAKVAVEVEDVTKSKVTARLTQLVAAEIARKEQVKCDDRKVMAYALATVAADEVAEDEDEVEE